MNCGDTPTHYARNAHLHRGPDVGIDGQKIRRQGNSKGGSGMDHQVGIPGEGNRNQQQGSNRPPTGDSSWGNQNNADNVNPWNRQQNSKGGSGSEMDHEGGMPNWGPQGNRNQQKGPNRPPVGDSWGNQGNVNPPERNWNHQQNSKGGSAMDHQGGGQAWGPQGNRNQQQGSDGPPVDGSSWGMQGNTKGGSAMDHQDGVNAWGPRGNQQQGPNRPPVGDSSWRGNEKGGPNRMGNRRPGGNTGNTWMNRNPNIQQNGGKGMDPRQGGQGGMGNRNAYVPRNGIGGNAHPPNQKGLGGNAPNKRRGNRRHNNGGRNGNVPNQNVGGNGNAHNQKGASVPNPNVQPDRGMRNRVRQGQHGQKGGGHGMGGLPNPGWGSGQSSEKGSSALRGTNEGFGNRIINGGKGFSPNHKDGQKGLGRGVPSEGSGNANLPGDLSPIHGRGGHKGQQQFGNNAAWNGDEGSGDGNLQDENAFSPNHRGGQKGQGGGQHNANGIYPNEGPVDANFQDQIGFSRNNRGQQQGGYDGGGMGHNKGPGSTRFESNRWSMNSRHFRHSSNHQKGDSYVGGRRNQDGSTQERGFERHWDHTSGNVFKDKSQTGIGEGVGDFAYDYPEGNSQQFKEYGTNEGKADYNDYSYAWNS